MLFDVRFSSFTHLVLRRTPLVQASSSSQDEQGKHEEHRSFVSRSLQCFLSTILFYFRWSLCLHSLVRENRIPLWLVQNAGHRAQVIVLTHNSK